jgi:outer membrane protein
MKTRPTVLFLLFITPSVFSQKNTVLDSYIREGLTNNAALKTAQFDIERSMNALEQAKTLFMPQVNFQMQYTLAAGGRSQSLPIGDLLNPVYSTLNKITQSNNFPSIENQAIKFLPNNFHETKIRATYPLVNKEIYYNREIKKELISVEQAKVQVYKRELVKNIKMAYIQYLQANQAIEIYKNALNLARENERVNQKLVKNQVATPAVVLKAQVEVAKVENSIFEIENQIKNAAAYFNFLLNKPLDSKIGIDSTIINSLNTPPQYNSIKKENLLQKREEFAQISGGERALTLQKQMNEKYKTPKIGAFMDGGFQGFGFKIWDKQAYLLAGASLEMPLYNGGNSKLKIQQTQIELQKVAAQRDEILQQIQLQTQVAQTNLETAQKALTVNEVEVTASREYYRLTDKRYREGQALQIELTDARTQMTAAELKQSLARYTVLLKSVELERAVGGYELK